MRTKTLILSAMIGAAGIVSSFAADNVYSVNVVGYINLSLTNKFSLIANQLDDGNGNYVTNLFTGMPRDTYIYKYDGTSYSNLRWQFTPPNIFAWTPAANRGMTLAPGEGVFVQNPTPGTPINITFVGEVLQGDLVNPVGVGFDIYSAMVPQQGGLVAVHNYVPAINDVVYQFDGVSYANRTWKKVPPNAPSASWQPAALGEPQLKVGEAFFINSASAKNWTRTFTVN